MLAWLLVALLIFVCIFLCGQLALLLPTRAQQEPTGQAKAPVDYSAWGYGVFAPLLPGFALETLQGIPIATVVGCLLPGTCDLPTATPAAVSPTPTRGPSATPGASTYAFLDGCHPANADGDGHSPYAHSGPVGLPREAGQSLAHPTRRHDGRLHDLVFNYGSSTPAELTQVIDTLDSSMSVDAGTCNPACVTAGGTVAWNYSGPPILQGNYVSFTFTADVSGTSPGDVLVNNVTIDGDNFSPASSARRVYVFVPPVARNDSFAAAEDTVLNAPAPGVLANDTDADMHAITAALVDDVDHGVLNLQADGSFTYAPDANWSGTDTFTYEACDPAALCDTATVTITVGAVNDAPVAAADSYTATEEPALSVPSSCGIPPEGLLCNDTDVESDPLTAELVSDAAHGSVVLAPDGSFTYMPVADYRGPDSFTYRPPMAC